MGAAACGRAAPAMTCAPWASPEQLATRPSPYDSIMVRTDTVLRAKLCYSRPLARDRTVFGALVPYDTLWRTGANEPTILHLSGPAQIAGLTVEAGDYSIYTVPSPAGWQVVVNASTSQWGLTREERGAEGNLFPNAYTEEVRAQEVGRAPIATEEVPYTDQLTARFESSGDNEHELLFDWETTRIVVPLRLLGEGS
jgi:hypothetical protein